MNPSEQIAILTTCRDHWKASFEHERTNVIRLRREVHRLHSMGGIMDCDCPDCVLVSEHGEKCDGPRPATEETGGQVPENLEKSVTDFKSEARGEAYKREKCLQLETNRQDPAASAPLVYGTDQQSHPYQQHEPAAGSICTCCGTGKLDLIGGPGPVDCPFCGPRFAG